MNKMDDPNDRTLRNDVESYEETLTSLNPEIVSEIIRKAIRRLSKHNIFAVHLTDSVLLVRGPIQGAPSTSSQFSEQLIDLKDGQPHLTDLFHIRSTIKTFSGVDESMLKSLSILGYDALFVEDGNDWGVKLLDRRNSNPIKEIIRGGNTLWYSPSEESGWTYTISGISSDLNVLDNEDD